MIVDEADEQLEMAEDPFLEAGIPELPDMPKRPEQVIDIKDIVRPDSRVSLAVSNASEIPLQICKTIEANFPEAEISIGHNDESTCTLLVQVNGEKEGEWGMNRNM